MALKQGVTAVAASLALGWGASTMSFAADQPTQVSTEQVALQVREMQQDLTEMQERIAKLNQVVAELEQKTTKTENKGRTGR
jgi:TolA-binding protein